MLPVYEIAGPQHCFPDPRQPKCLMFPRFCNKNCGLDTGGLEGTYMQAVAQRDKV